MLHFFGDLEDMQQSDRFFQPSGGVGEGRGLRISATLSALAVEKSNTPGELSSSDEKIRNDRPAIDAVLFEALDASQMAAKLHRAAAETMGAVIDRAKVDVDRCVSRMRRDSLLVMAKSAEAWNTWHTYISDGQSPISAQWDCRRNSHKPSVFLNWRGQGR